MRRLVLCCLLFSLMGVHNGLLAAARDTRESPRANLYFLGIALDQEGNIGGWAQVGPKGAWKDTIGGAVLNDALYTIERDGTLYATNLTTGNWHAIGKPEFAASRFIFAAGGSLYTIENDGSLFRVSPKDGTWAQVGEAGAWKKTGCCTVLFDQLYSIEKDGGLFVTDLNTGKWQQLGKPEFGKTRLLYGVGRVLLTIEEDGSLYQVNPADGKWKQLGQAGAWKDTAAGTAMSGHLYTAENAGGLYFTDPHNGTWGQIGKAEFGNTKFMFPFKGQLFTIESDGSLYRVSVKAGPTIDSFNWCTEEIEKVFREQGKDFYRTMESKHILGAKATHDEALAGMDWLKQKATKNDLVVIYVGAHGFTDPKQGWGIVSADNNILWGSELKAKLAQFPCQALVIIETCTSGGFAQQHPGDPPVPGNVTAFCACAADQSTNNQLDLAVGEALWGRADFDGNGVIDVEELEKYIRLRYREWWPNPKAKDDSEAPVIVLSKGLSQAHHLTRVSPNLAAIAVRNDLWSAIVEKQDGEKYQVHLLGWSNHPGESYFVTNSVTRDAICLAADGKPVLVKHGGQWWPARLTKHDGNKSTVDYLGRNQQEVVSDEQVKYPFVGKAP